MHGFSVDRWHAISVCSAVRYESLMFGRRCILFRRIISIFNVWIRACSSNNSFLIPLEFQNNMFMLDTERQVKQRLCKTLRRTRTLISFNRDFDIEETVYFKNFSGVWSLATIFKWIRRDLRNDGLTSQKS